MRIADLIHGLNIRVADESGVAGSADVRVCDLTEDSRTVMPGSLFIARKGEKSDGRQFVPGAIKVGAVAILTDDPDLRLPPVPKSHGPVVLLITSDIQEASARLAERFYGDPSSKLTVIGVTGTNGKTTTTFLIHQILNHLGIRCGLMGTVWIDDGTEVAPATLTTPPSLEVSRTLARMHEAGCAAAVMEVSSHSLHQKRVGAINFNAAVFTNLTGDHLDYHKTMEEYAAAKAILFESLAPETVAVVNVSDPAHTRMVRGCKARVVRCSVPQPLSLRPQNTPASSCAAYIRAAATTHTEVTFVGPWGSQDVRLPLAGAFNVMNALQAAAVVHAVFGGTGEDDVSFGIIAQALEHCSAPPGRLEPVTRTDAPISVFVDYAHSDDALRTVLSTVRGAMPKVGNGSLWCVFGCGGDRDKTKRPRMGEAAARLADRVVVTSDNPRTEQARQIIAEIVAGIPGGSLPRVSVEPDREAAIRLAIRKAAPGDVVVIAGKGHEDYQILPDPDKPGATITRHFDDREVVRDALAARGIASRPAVVPARPAGGRNEEEESLLSSALLEGDDPMMSPEL